MNGHKSFHVFNPENIFDKGEKKKFLKKKWKENTGASQQADPFLTVTK